MKLIIKSEAGLALLRPSKRHLKVAWQEKALGWAEVLEPASSRRLYPREERIGPGAHEVERIDNPFVPGGESWLVLKGSRIGAAEAYIKRLVASTRGTSNAVELATDTEPATLWPAPQRSAA